MSAVLFVQPAQAAARTSLDALAQNFDTEFEELLSSDKLLPGDSISDWIALVSGRCGAKSDSYLKNLQEHVTDAYASSSGLDYAKATEWHRISLTALALGGDPTAFGKDSHGTPVNLIADGTYNWHTTDTLGTQGLNAWIFALITLDSKTYCVPEDAAYTRGKIIQTILESQEADGGFGLTQGNSNLDITAMTLQALAPYCNSTVVYHLASGKDTTVRDAVTASMQYLHQQQTSDGSFGNSCSTAQVVVALCSLGIDPATFAEDGHNAEQGLLSYQTENGLFSYLPQDSNHDVMATEQVILALSSLDRLRNHQRRIFDFRPEMESDLQQQIQSLNDDINALIPEQLDDQAQVFYDRYQQIPAPERSYVSAYWKLADAMERSGLEVNADDPAEAYNLTSPTQVKNTHTIWWIAAAVLAVGAVTLIVVLQKKGKQQHV